MDREEIFREISYLGRMLQAMGAIVQNEGPPPPKEDLLKWAQDINEICERAQEVKKCVIIYCLEKSK